MFTWYEFLVLANAWLLLIDGHPNREALIRCIISSAYYAAYHCACDYLEAIGEYPCDPNDQKMLAREKGSHRIVLDLFRNDTTHPGWKKIGKKLWRLKDARAKADYTIGNFSLFTESEEVREIVKEAEKTIELIKALPTIER